MFYVYPDVIGPAANSNGTSAIVGLRDANGNTNGRVLQFEFNGTPAANLLANGDLITIVVPGPEPMSLILAGIGLTGLALRARRKKTA